ncbi:MAG: sialate O-acetylesterase [Pseudomonadota bacterium]
MPTMVAPTEMTTRAEMTADPAVPSAMPDGERDLPGTGLAGAPNQTAEPPLRIVIMAGQSNMVGYRTRVEDLARRWRKPQPGCLFWKNGTWRPLIPGKLSQRTAFGPELSLAHWLTNAEDGPVGIVKVAMTATSLAEHWAPGIRRGLFTTLVDQTRAALAARPARLCGLAWLQGESDSMDEEHAAAYRKSFEDFIERFRIAIAAPTLPVAAAVVNPPADQAPYRHRVRRAQKSARVENYRTIGMDDLAMQADGLHLKARGLSLIGKRFAETLYASPPADTVTQWLWNTPDYQCWYTGPQTVPDRVLVTFPYASAQSGFEDYAFGQKAFEKRGVGTIYIRNHLSNWFQHEEVMPLADRIRRFVGPTVGLTLYGASMGAYAGLLLSGRLRARRVVAVAPQYSIDRTDVPEETRWARAATRIGTFRYRLEDSVSPDAQKYVFCDRLSLDRPQIDRLPTDDSWTMVNLPFASHMLLRFFKETECLQLWGDFLTGKDVDAAHIYRTARSRRRQSSIYWLSLGEVCRARRPDLAITAFENAITAGGKESRIRRFIDEVKAERDAFGS